MAIAGDLLQTALDAAHAYGVDEDVFLNQIAQESGFQPGADSGQANGIAQFTPETAAGLGIDPSDPIQSLYGAAALMRSYLDRYQGSYPLALAAYNAGPGAVDKAGGVPDFPETQQYVQTILGNSGGGPMADTNTPTAEPAIPADPNGPAPTDWNSLVGGGTKPPALPKVNGLDINAAAQLAAARGYKGLGQGEGFGSLWAGPDGQPVALEAIVKRLTSASGGATGTPTRFIGGVTYTQNPTTGAWEPINGQTARPNLTQDPGYIQAQTAKTNQDIAQAKVAQNWLVQKQLFEQAQGLRKEAADTQQRIQDLGTKIGQLAQNPIDRGDEAATILANSDWGAANRTPAITNDSLAPLAGLLGQRSAAFADLNTINAQAGKAQTAFDQFNPQAGVFPQPTTGQPPAHAAAPLPSSQPVLPQTQMTTPTMGTPNTTPPGMSLNLNALAPPQQGAIPPDAALLPARASGGDVEGAYISGERGPEINIPTADGAIVINSEQAKHLGINLDKLKKYADGGIFNLGVKPVQPGSIFGDEAPTTESTALARGFLQKALQRATAGTPFNPQALPAPVFASSPGMSPDVTKLLASLNSMAGLYSPEEYQRLAQVYAPQGITAQNIGRAA